MVKIKYSKIVSIKEIGIEETWDIEMPYPNNYVANKFVVHNSGQTMQYVNRKLGKEQVKYEHPLLENITKDTRGIILYQEQIMQIMNQIGGMSWATAEMARKVITKSKGKKAFEEMRAEFVANANRINGMPTVEAEKLYDVVSTFGSYSFNKAHAVEYSIISYWCAWLKTYYPLQFYKSILMHETDDAQIANYLNDADKNGVEVVYPHINHSKFRHNIKDGKIYSGFNAIKGIGEKTAAKIIAAQPYANPDDFVQRCKVGKKIKNNLILADGFRSFDINKKASIESESFVHGPESYKPSEYAKLILANTTLKPNIDILEAFNFGDYEYEEIVSLGDEQGGTAGYIRGIVTAVINKDKLIREDIKSHPAGYENHMIYLNVNDGTGNLAIQVNPWTYTKYKDIIHTLENKPVVIYGTFSKGGQKMYAELLEIPDVTADIKQFKEKLIKGDTLIATCSPGVSKKGNAYYRIQLSNGVKGLCFGASKPLEVGMSVQYRMTKEPFMEIKIK